VRIKVTYSEACIRVIRVVFKYSMENTGQFPDASRLLTNQVQDELARNLPLAAMSKRPGPGTNLMYAPLAFSSLTQVSIIVYSHVLYLS
jgi:hypothetical protein